MATFSKQKLSGSADGRMVKVAAVATPGTLIHQAAAAGTWDELWLWAVNSDPAGRKLTIEFGGVGAPDDLIEQTIAPEAGLTLIVPGLIVTNAINVRAFAAAANLVMVVGYVNRIA